MKKLFALATMAALLTAGAAFAGGPVSSLNAGRMFIQPNASFTPTTFDFVGGVRGQATGPTSTNNDDTCDISVMPAATLLLPYFEVDFRQPSTSAVNTNFTITNVSQFPQIAHVTLWTDWSYPVLDFNIFLTGYDVQGINLFDVIARGNIPVTGSGLQGAGGASFRGPRSVATNPNFAQPGTTADAAVACNTLGGPGIIPGSPAVGATAATGLLLDIQNALSRGTYGTRCPGGAALAVGSDRGAAGLAAGYVTVDVANTCSTTLPTTSTYYTNEILFDNVLIGDYQRINPLSGGVAGQAGDAGGNPMVHIRAIPEGGPASGAGVTAVNLPFTFYDRYTPAFGATAPLGRKSDRRQPLPGVFAARYISGGTGQMDTRLNIFREGLRTGAQTEACSLLSQNGAIPTTEIVRFDEHENPSTFTPQTCPVSPCTPDQAPQFSLPEASSNSVSNNQRFPALTSPAGDVGGWIYLNLNNGGSQAYSQPRQVFVPATATAAAIPAGTHPGASQNWVTITQSANTNAAGRFSVEFDAAALGNGCSGNPGVSGGAGTSGTGPAIGPLGGAVTGTNATP